MKEVFDYVIVGSGASGATAARVLVETGASVAVLEEGPRVETAEFSDKVFPTFQKIYRDAGIQMARGRAFIPVIQGRCLGGSTVVNSAIVWRLGEDVWETWKTVHGLGEALPLKALRECWDVIERDLSIAPTPSELWGRNGELMRLAASRMGVSHAPLPRNARGCRGSARCVTGCPHGAKQSMLVSYLPYAEKKGAALIAEAKAERVILRGDRAVAVSASTKKGPLLLAARKAVIVAASAIQTPGLLSRSGVRSAHLGRHFQGHPGCGLVGLFEQKANPWFGATQSYGVHHHRRSENFNVDTISLPPEMLLPLMPGAGRRWEKAIDEMPHAASWIVQTRAYAEGTVRERFFGTDIRFDLESRDVDTLKRGLRFAAELFFAAGAREVLPDVYGLPERIRPGQESLFDEGPDDPASYSLILSHLFGTARMSVRPRDGVVGPDFRVHGSRNLYVVDSSVFPTSTGVNPQHTIMGVAMLAAQRLSETAP